MSTNENILQKMTEISQRDQRYPREALLFVLNGIQWSFVELGQRRHLSGQEFTEMLVAYARQEFGGLAHTVFQEWGIFSTSDLGEIVYLLIEAGLMTKQEEDSIEDFDNVLDLEEALRAPEFSPRVSS